MKNLRKEQKAFKPKSKLLLELGDHLIKNESIALSELVKNAYDADATEVEIRMDGDTPEDIDEIHILDNGTGMDWHTASNIWMEPGTTNKKKLIDGLIRTKKFNRLPLGQKGIGRFGVHKLGKKIEIITKSYGENEIVIIFDWEEFEKRADSYLDDVKIDIFERAPKFFIKNTGTNITIKNLSSKWNKTKLEKVFNSIESLSSPIKGPESFSVKFKLFDENQKIVEEFKHPQTILDYAVFKINGHIENGKMSYKYTFKPFEELLKFAKIGTRVKKVSDFKLEKTTNHLGEEHKIGRIELDLHIYDLSTDITRHISSETRKNITSILKMHGGLSLYRDGVKICSNEESAWLDLDVKRVNQPAVKLSNNIIIGEIRIKREESLDLIEKTNREGFIENEAFIELKSYIEEFLKTITVERNFDKANMREILSKREGKALVLYDLEYLEKEFEKDINLNKKYGERIKRIKNDYSLIKERLLFSSGVGISFSIIIHEAEKILNILLEELKLKEPSKERLEFFVNTLVRITDGYGNLIKKDKKSDVKASKIIEQSLFNLEYRLDKHNIKVLYEKNIAQDFILKNCSRQLLVATIMNMIDNSIYWISKRNPEEKYIFFDIKNSGEEGQIIIGDNGTGFIDELNILTEPFFTRKKDGMGLGLHIAKEIILSYKGNLKLLNSVKNKKIDGAIICMKFNIK